MFKSFKAKLLGLFTLGAVMATSASAESAPILSDAQSQSLLDALTSGYGQLIGLMVGVVSVSAAFYLIYTAIRRFGRGQI